MSHVDVIIQFRKTVNALLMQGRTKNSIRKDAGLNTKKYHELFDKPEVEIVMRASTRGKLQDFNKRYIDSLMPLPEDASEDFEPTPENVKPISWPATDREQTAADIMDKFIEQRKASTTEFLQKLSDLCVDHKPSNIEITVTIK